MTNKKINLLLFTELFDEGIQSNPISNWLIKSTG